jgi:hypothetical protein
MQDEVIPVAVELLTVYRATAEQKKNESDGGEDDGDDALLRRVMARLPVHPSAPSATANYEGP